MLRRITIALLALFAGAHAVHAETVQEVIFFISEDGRTYQRYSGMRTDYGSYNLYFDKGETIDNYLYFFPNEFSWDRTNAENDIIRLQQGDYSYINEGRFEDEIEVAPNGDFLYMSDKDKERDSPRFGYWTSPGNFSKFVFVWVFPKNLAVVDTKSNRDGEWVRRKNAVAWFGNDVNNIAFSIRYRAKTNVTMNSLRKAFSGVNGVSLQQSDEGVRLTLAETILFPSGSAKLSDSGRIVIAKLTHAIEFTAGLQAIVEGHTDNVAISGTLAEKYSTNWELSAGRALAVVRAMEEDGAPGPQLEARAFGEYRPIADNSTMQGRAANRRISILVSDR